MVTIAMLTLENRAIQILKRGKMSTRIGRSAPEEDPREEDLGAEHVHVLKAASTTPTILELVGTTENYECPEGSCKRYN